MGTRGLLIIKVNGQYYRYWNAMDSYPGWLGMELLKRIMNYQATKDRMKSLSYEGSNDNIFTETTLTLTEETTCPVQLYGPGSPFSENPFTTEVLHGHVRDLEHLKEMYREDDIVYVYIMDFDDDLFIGGYAEKEGLKFMSNMTNYKSCEDALNTFAEVSDDGNDWNFLLT